MQTPNVSMNDLAAYAAIQRSQLLIEMEMIRERGEAALNAAIAIFDLDQVKGDELFDESDRLMAEYDALDERYQNLCKRY